MKLFFFRHIILIASFFVLVGCGVVSFDETQYDDMLASVRESNDLAEAWFLENFREKGIFEYTYDPDDDTSLTTNNMIRQLMASRLLAEMSQENTELQELHLQNLDYIFRYWYRETEDENLGYIFYNGRSKLGANAMALRTLVYSPFFSEYADRAEQLANGIISMMYPTGRLRPYFVVSSAHVYEEDYIMSFYSGEAILALVEYAIKVDSSDYLDIAIKAQDFYIEKYVKNIDINYYPAYVPWHTIALAKLYASTQDDKYANAIFIMNDELLRIQDTTEHIGRFYNPDLKYNGLLAEKIKNINPHVASDGVYTDGLAYAYEVAEAMGDAKRQKKYADALELSVHNLRSLQYTSENIPADWNADKVIGGFFARPNAHNIRIDNVQHAIDAYRKILEVFKIESY